MEVIECGRFDSLKSKYANIYTLCYGAEKLISETYGKAEEKREEEFLACADYSDCMVRIRKALEAVLSEAISKFGLVVKTEYKTPSVEEMIDELSRNGLLNDGMDSKCHRIRQDGNGNAHVQENISLGELKQMTKNNLDNLVEISEWLLLNEDLRSMPVDSSIPFRGNSQQSKPRKNSMSEMKLVSIAMIVFVIGVIIIFAVIVSTEKRSQQAYNNSMQEFNQRYIETQQQTNTYQEKMEDLERQWNEKYNK